MRAQCVAPGELAGELRGDAQHDRIACDHTELGLRPHASDLLFRERVQTLADWCRLGPGRLDALMVEMRR